MRLSEFSYKLPGELIAQQPVSPRDHSRLLVLDRVSGCLEHKHFFDLPKFLKRGDVLVLNDTKVFPARLIGEKAESGGKIEVFLLKEIKRGIWQCLIGGKLRHGKQKIIFSKNFCCKIISRQQDGTWLAQFNLAGKNFLQEISKIGQVPLPPYIKRDKPSKSDEKRYQTIYANKNHAGSVAAPTAGLHFTPQLLKKIKARGVKLVYVTLHVGLGTFASVKTEMIKKHKMHSEWFEVKKKIVESIIRAKRENRRIIAVGTTSARILETIFKRSDIKNYTGFTDIFIYPGYKFRAVDALITNFHLPGSTLLMLISAFAGQKKGNKSAGLAIIKKSYQEAIKKKYRFFSYGDAMFIS